MPGGGSKPGERRGGRKRGTPNRRTILGESVRKRLEDLGLDPIAVLAVIAQGVKYPADIRCRAAAELARYVWPRRGAVELTGPAGGPVRVEGDAREKVWSILNRITERIRAGAGEPRVIELRERVAPNAR